MRYGEKCKYHCNFYPDFIYLKCIPQPYLYK